MLKYIGKSFIVGIPARDLNDEEVERFGKKKLLDSGLYAEVRHETISRKRKNVRAELPEEVNNGWS